MGKEKKNTKDMLLGSWQVGNLAVSVIKTGKPQPAPWLPEITDHYSVKVRNSDKKKEATFDYWSEVPEEDGRESVLGIALCGLMDAQAARMTYKDFAKTSRLVSEKDIKREYGDCQKLKVGFAQAGIGLEYAIDLIYKDLFDIPGNLPGNDPKRKLKPNATKTPETALKSISQGGDMEYQGPLTNPIPPKSDSAVKTNGSNRPKPADAAQCRMLDRIGREMSDKWPSLEQRKAQARVILAAKQDGAQAMKYITEYRKREEAAQAKGKEPKLTMAQAQAWQKKMDAERKASVAKPIFKRLPGLQMINGKKVK
jgi:hypothetical protein